MPRESVEFRSIAFFYWQPAPLGGPRPASPRPQDAYRVMYGSQKAR